MNKPPYASSMPLAWHEQKIYEAEAILDDNRVLSLTNRSLLALATSWAATTEVYSLGFSALKGSVSLLTGLSCALVPLNATRRVADRLLTRNAWNDVCRTTNKVVRVFCSALLLPFLSIYKPMESINYVYGSDFVKQPTRPLLARIKRSVPITSRQVRIAGGLLGALALTYVAFEAYTHLTKVPEPIRERIINKPKNVKSKAERKITIGTTYVNGDNKNRDDISQVVNKTHAEYATKWNLTHEIEERNLLQGACKHRGRDVDCEPYWNKIAVLRRWLSGPTVPKSKKEWYIMADDDMPVTNMRIDPSAAIDTLRDKSDSSIIIAKDVQAWNGNPETSVNTGLMIVRKDERSRKFFDWVWDERNTGATGFDYCPTLGVCKKQASLHEQQGFTNVLINRYSQVRDWVSVVEPRDTYSSSRSHLALNTFQRNGCYMRQDGIWTGKAEYNDPSVGEWKKGDWMGQTAGVPVWGWWCGDYNHKPPGPLRLDRINDMVSQIVR